MADSKLEEEPALPSHTDLLPADQTRILAQVRHMALTRVHEALAFVYQHPGRTLTLTLTLTRVRVRTLLLPSNAEEPLPLLP